MHCLLADRMNHNKPNLLMLLRFTGLTIVLFWLTACIGLKPKPDTTKIYVLGLTEPIQNNLTVPVAKGYIARPQLPTYMEGYGLKFISDDSEIVDIPDARWAEPIDMGVARALGACIERLNGGLKSNFYPWTRPHDATFTLQVNFHRLIATGDGRILIAADWQYKHASGKTENGVFTNNTIKWSPENAQSMVVGINTALDMLSNAIVASLKKEFPNTK